MSEVFIIYAVIIVGMVIIASSMAKIQREKEQDQLLETKLAPQLGLTYLDKLDFLGLEKQGVRSLLMGRFKTTGLAQNVLAGSLKGLNILFFTYITPYPSRREQQKKHPTFIVSTSGFHSLPLFVIRPPELLDGLKETIGYQFIKIPAAPSLVVQIAKEQTETSSALAHVPPELWQLIETNQWTVVHDGQWFMVYAYNRPLSDLESHQKFITAGLDIFVHFLPESTELKVAS